MISSEHGKCSIVVNASIRMSCCFSSTPTRKACGADIILVRWTMIVSIASKAFCCCCDKVTAATDFVAAAVDFGITDAEASLATTVAAAASASKSCWIAIWDFSSSASLFASLSAWSFDEQLPEMASANCCAALTLSLSVWSKSCSTCSAGCSSDVACFFCLRLFIKAASLAEGF